MTACQGAGRRWMSGTGNPLCPVCHRGWRALGLTRRPKVGNHDFLVPDHERRTR